jgi:predicted RNA binding protein YcfA (HicA-like mRNA interferase family)
MPMTFKELERIIKKDGWYQVSSEGSHYQYKHPKKKGRVTLPYHSGDIFIGIVNSVLKQAGLK